jgi:peptidoglycan-N-acetylglucosamine deacetylase
MSRGWICFYLFVFMFLLYTPKVSAASTVKNIPIGINDEFVSFPDAIPYIENNTTYVPIRFFSEAISATLTIEEQNIISLELDEISFKMYINRDEIKFSDGKKVKASLFVKNGRTYAPLRILGEYFGYQIHYIAEGPIVRLINTVDILEREPFIKLNQTMIKDFFQKAMIDNRPKVYLTFDDGPNPGIKEILDILKKKKAKASFFMIEPQMRKYPNDLKRLVNEGHYPALHSVTHNKNLLYEGKPSAVANEMLKAQKTLLELTGIRSALTRAPFGSKPYMVKSFRDELARHKLKMWDWDIDSLDWQYRTNPQQIVKNVKEGFKEKKNKRESIVILFHINSGTVAVLPKIIDYIYAQGYQCVPYNPTEHLVVNFWKDGRL